MKPLEKTKKRQILFLNGNNDVSKHVNPAEMTYRCIENYHALYWDGNPEHTPIMASDTTEDRFRLLLNESQARAVVKFQNNEFAPDSMSAENFHQITTGIFVLLWKEHFGLTPIHFLWIECSDLTCRNISLSSYGYKDDEVLNIFKNVFAAMSTGISHMENLILPMTKLPDVTDESSK